MGDQMRIKTRKELLATYRISVTSDPTPRHAGRLVDVTPPKPKTGFIPVPRWTVKAHEATRKARSYKFASS